MQPMASHLPIWHVPSGAQVSPAPQSDGLPQYTGLPPLELLELELLELDELLELELLVDPLELLAELELLELEVPNSQLAVRSALMTQDKPSGHPQTVQSPEWH